MKAEVMFKELGFNIDRKVENKFIIYWKPLKLNRELQIGFDFEHKTIDKMKIPGMYAETITMKELKAINQQINELGWLDE